MKSDEFNYLFDQEFALPLIEIGFEFVGRGKTLKYCRDLNELRLIRLGGKLARVGCMRSKICFRHSFLRPTQTDDPSEKNLYVSDFPRKQELRDFKGFLKPRLRYRPHNRRIGNIDSFEYGQFSRQDVCVRLRKLRKVFEERIIPWANSLTPENELEQLKRFGEGAWCEKRWIEDYENFLSNKR